MAPIAHLRRKLYETHSRDIERGQSPQNVRKTIVAAKIALIGVARANKFCTVAEPRKEEFHLLRSRILDFFCDNKAVFECPASQMLECQNLDERTSLDALFYLIIAVFEFGKCHKYWLQERLDLFFDGSGQIAVLLSGPDGRTNNINAPMLICVEPLKRTSSGTEGFSGAALTMKKDEIVVRDFFGGKFLLVRRWFVSRIVVTF